MDKLITDYEIELTEPGCTPGSGRYGLLLTLVGDISAVFPYLNTLLDDTMYDHDNHILIGRENDRRFAFRANEIRVSGIDDVTEVANIARTVVERVNSVWLERATISPSFKERKIPAVFDIYRLLPKSNCKECGYLTCLAFAADVRNSPELLDRCSQLFRPENADMRVRIERLFTGE